MSNWPVVPLREVLTQVDRRQKVDVERSYRLLGVRLEGAGPFHRETVSGTETSAASLSEVKNGDFIYSRLFAWRGAFGRISPGLDGCFVSNEFPTFLANAQRIDTRYLEYWFRLKPTINAVAENCKGSTPLTRNRFKENFFFDLQIPLPPLPEQQRLVERIDSLAAKIEEAKRLRAEADSGLDALCRSVLNGSGSKDSTPTPMGELVRQREPDVVVRSDETYHFAGVYCFGRGLFIGQRKTGMEFQYPRLTRLRTNDFVYPKLMAWEGALATVPPVCNGLVVSTEYPVFEIDTSKVLPEVLDIYFRTPEVWPALSGTSTGTNVRRRRLNPADFLRYKFPLPSMATQQQVNAIRKKADATTGIRTTQQKQIEAMLPAILDRAFRGEL
ncbi:hypothetical protein BH11PLA2_BH11PLA2_38260 [soil metagenome]